MALMVSPGNEVLDIPAEGVHAMRALGWELRDPEPRAQKNPKASEPAAEAPAVVAATPDGEPPAVTATEIPKPYASRGDWARHAASLGVESEGLTKAQIVEALTPKE